MKMRIPGSLNTSVVNAIKDYMYMVLRFAVLIVVVLGVFSCADNNGGLRSESGFIRPEIKIDPQITYIDASGERDLNLNVVPEENDFMLTLKSEMSDRSATWDNPSLFSSTTPYLTGPYTLTVRNSNPFVEGFESPYFTAETQFNVGAGEIIRVPLLVKLENTAVVSRFEGDFDGTFADFSVVYHTEGGDYETYPISHDDPLYLKPGKLSLGFDLTTNAGEHARIMVASLPELKAGCIYESLFTIGSGDMGGDVVNVAFGAASESERVSVAITPELFSRQTPTVIAEGYDPSEALTIVEGIAPTTPIKMIVEGRDIHSIMLNIQSRTLLDGGCPRQIDLLNMDEQTSLLLAGFDLKFEQSQDLYSVDFTKVLPRLRPPRDMKNVSFILMAIGNDGNMSEPMRLDIAVNEADFKVLEIDRPVIGIDKARLTLNIPASSVADNLVIELKHETSDEWERIIPENIESLSATTSAITIDAGTGVSNVEVRFSYCGAPSERIVIQRQSPVFSIEADPFAQSVRLKLHCDQPDVIPMLVRQVMALSSEGDERIVISLRDADAGEVFVSGLTPETRYRLRLSLFPHPSSSQNTSNEVIFTTEAAASIPNTDFEDVRETINYKDMPCGGRYSQNMVAIFNGQNKQWWKVNTPRRWANTNAKTFCTASAQHNTWYMQPSVNCIMNNSNSYAVELRTVAWDIHGEPIADYLQTTPPFVNYSRNVPHISNTSAGKLFLGSYSFNPGDMTETYSEGIRFRSRPSSLNGFYKFLPCEAMPTDRGVAIVEVLGNIGEELVVIGRGRTELSFATGFTGFTVPINYTIFGVKANTLKVMFASSIHIGTIEEETEQIAVSYYPEQGAGVGGVLTLDNITLSY